MLPVALLLVLQGIGGDETPFLTPTLLTPGITLVRLRDADVQLGDDPRQGPGDGAAATAVHDSPALAATSSSAYSLPYLLVAIPIWPVCSDTPWSLSPQRSRCSDAAWSSDDSADHPHRVTPTPYDRRHVGRLTFAAARPRSGDRADGTPDLRVRARADPDVATATRRTTHGCRVARRDRRDDHRRRARVRPGVRAVPRRAGAGMHLQRSPSLPGIRSDRTQRGGDAVRPRRVGLVDLRRLVVGGSRSDPRRERHAALDGSTGGVPRRSGRGVRQWRYLRQLGGVDHGT